MAYDLICIHSGSRQEFYSNQTADNAIIPVIEGLDGHLNFDTTSNQTGVRQYTLEKNGITFSDYIFDNSVINDHVIPYSIYGIKLRSPYYLTKSFEKAKADLVSSNLSKALGLTTETEWDDMVRSFLNVIDYSNAIQYASTDTSNTTKSCYRTNGSNIEIVPARGLWNAWDWAKSCIRIPKLSVTNNLTTGSYASNSTGISQTISISLTLKSTSGILVCCAGHNDGENAPGISYIVSNGSVTLKQICNLSKLNTETSYPAATRLVVWAYSNNKSGTVTISKGGTNGSVIAVELK